MSTLTITPTVLMQTGVIIEKAGHFVSQFNFTRTSDSRNTVLGRRGRRQNRRRRQ